MTEAQRVWAAARNRLTGAVRAAGFPEELSDLLAKELRSPRAIDRMTSWINQAHPRSLETIVDEMLAIRADLDAWAEKKESAISASSGSPVSTRRPVSTERATAS